MKKNIALILAAALVLPTVIAAGGCGANSGVSSSAEATGGESDGIDPWHTVSPRRTPYILP